MTASEDADFGRRLRQAREARGVSLRQIASSTKISTSVLDALERNDFSKLPGGIFGRAFVRSYAQEVGLDPDETVREFIEQAEGESLFGPPLVPVRPVDEDENLFESRRRMAGVAFKLFLISAPIAALLFYLTLSRSRPASPPLTPAAPRPTAGAPAGAVRPETIPQPQPALSVAAPPSPPAVMDRADDSTRAPEPPVAPASDDEGFLLEVGTTGPCWVSLTVDGAIVLSKVMSAEERVARRVRTGALIQVGDAGAFAFSLNGRPARPLGDSGQVRSVQITPANYVSFLR